MLQASSVSSSTNADEEEEEAMAGDFSDKLKAEAYVKLDIVAFG